MKGKMTLERGKKKVPLILMAIGMALALALLIVRLNIVAILCVLYCCILSAGFIIALIAKQKVYAPMVYGFAAALAGVAAYYIIWGADAGFGAFSSGLAGYSSAENSLFTGEGNFGTRLLGNILLALPCSLCLWGLFFVARKSFKKEGAKKALSGLLSVLLTGCCVFYVFTMNLRAKPNTERLWEGHDDYLSHVDKTATADSPNVLFILMDDLGWGDVSLNGAIYDTPNIDSIGENGLNFENFYSSYSVCSPARFAAMTGRYPYRGYAEMCEFYEAAYRAIESGSFPRPLTPKEEAAAFAALRAGDPSARNYAQAAIQRPCRAAAAPGCPRRSCSRTGAGRRRQSPPAA